MRAGRPSPRLRGDVRAPRGPPGPRHPAAGRALPRVRCARWALCGCRVSGGGGLLRGAADRDARRAHATRCCTRTLALLPPACLGAPLGDRVVLLHGPPGTGKTSLCKGLAQKLAIRLSDRCACVCAYVRTHTNARPCLPPLALPSPRRTTPRLPSLPALLARCAPGHSRFLVYTRVCLTVPLSQVSHRHLAGDQRPQLVLQGILCSVFVRACVPLSPVATSVVRFLPRLLCGARTPWAVVGPRVRVGR